MRTALKVTAWIIGGLAALCLLSGVGVYLFVSSAYFRGLVENHLNESTGRKSHIGQVVIDWGSLTHVTLSDVNLSNTDWAKMPHMLEADVVDFDIRLWPILHGQIDIPTLTVKAPRIDLEKNEKGVSNWGFQESPVAASAVNTVKPTERTEAPVIDHLSIDNGEITYVDQQRHLSLKGKINIASGAAAAKEEVHLALKGAIQEKPLTVTFTGGSVLMLRNSSAPYPLDFKATYGETKLTVTGRITDPFKFEGANVKLDLAGPDLAEVFPLLGIPAPPTPPYHLAGDLSRSGDVWKLSNLSGVIGKSDISGDISIDGRAKKSFLRADLSSKSLNFDDLGPLVGVPPSTNKGDIASSEQQQQQRNLNQQQNLFPTKPLHVELLQQMDMDVTLDAKHVTAAPYLPVRALMGHVKIKDGNADVDPLKLSVAGGTLQGSIGLDSRPEKPVAKADLAFQNLDLKTFFSDSKYFATTDGKVVGYVNLTGKGHSLAEVFGAADGDAGLAMTGGSISGLLIDLAGLDIGHALILYITEDHRLPIRCALGRMVFQGGTASFDRTRLDTERSVLHVDGKTELNSQAINMKISADAKKFSLLDLEAPVVFKGKIRSPDISIGKKVPIPLIELGGAKDLNCPSEIRSTLGDRVQISD